MYYSGDPNIKFSFQVMAGLLCFIGLLAALTLTCIRASKDLNRNLCIDRMYVRTGERHYWTDMGCLDEEQYSRYLEVNG